MSYDVPEGPDQPDSVLPAKWTEDDWTIAEFPTPEQTGEVDAAEWAAAQAQAGGDQTQADTGQQSVDEEVLTELGREIFQQREVIATLQKQMGDLRGVLEKIVARRRSDGEQAPWLYHQPPAGIDEDGIDLDSWVTWANSIYPRDVADDGEWIVPPCWRDHPGLAAQVSTLAWSWQRAFVDAAATAEAGESWHSTILRQFIDRRQSWCSSVCLKQGRGCGQNQHEAASDEWVGAMTSMTNR